MKIIKPITMTAGMLTYTTVPEDDYTEWVNTTSYVVGDKVRMTTYHKIYEAIGGKTSTVTISAASPAVVGWVYHGLSEGSAITFTNSGGALPTALVAGTTYYVKTPLADSFNIAATIGGAAINCTGGSGTHTAHTNRALAPNTNIDATSPQWIEFSATNRWKAFDLKIGDQVSQTSSIQYVITPGQIVKAIAFMNIEANSMTFTLDPTDPAVSTYSKSETLISVLGIVDAMSYFFNAIQYTTEVAYTDLPLASGVMTITLTSSGTAKIGEIIFGDIEKLGLTEYSPSISITDYSKKETDVFGNYQILQRAYSSRMSIDMWLPPALVDTLKRTLVLIRATPVVWIGADDPVLTSPTYGESMYSSMVIYGFYKSFNIVISSMNSSACSLEIEGLT